MKIERPSVLDGSCYFNDGWGHCEWRYFAAFDALTDSVGAGENRRMV